MLASSTPSGKIIITFSDQTEWDELSHEIDDVELAIRQEWFPKFHEFQSLLERFVDFEVADED